MTSTLYLRLAGPMQSWGQQARGDFREAGDGAPTRSGIVGLLGCAMGIRSEAGLREISDAIQVAVRIDKPGIRMVDFQVIGGQHRQGDGGSKRTDYRLTTWREYLVDADFLAAVRGDAALVEDLARAVMFPRWPYYLGRKACPPGAPVFAGIGEFPDIEAALLAFWPDDAEQLSARIEDTEGDLSVMDRRDSGRLFLPNRYKEVILRRPL